jgi:hypothetical protein
MLGMAGCFALRNVVPLSYTFQKFCQAFSKRTPEGIWIFLDTFDGAKPRFLNRGKKRRSVSTLSIPWASHRGVEWVDYTDLKRGLSRFFFIVNCRISKKNGGGWEWAAGIAK